MSNKVNAFDSDIRAAISKYYCLALGSDHAKDDGSYSLSDSIRQETATWMHENHPDWNNQFSMDLVEWILVTYHGAKR